MIYLLKFNKLNLKTRFPDCRILQNLQNRGPLCFSSTRHQDYSRETRNSYFIIRRCKLKLFVPADAMYSDNCRSVFYRTHVSVLVKHFFVSIANEKYTRIHSDDTSSSMLSISLSDRVKDSCRTPETVASCERLAGERRKESKPNECSKRAVAWLAQFSNVVVLSSSRLPTFFRQWGFDGVRTRGIAKICDIPHAGIIYFLATERGAQEKERERKRESKARRVWNSFNDTSRNVKREERSSEREEKERKRDRPSRDSRSFPRRSADVDDCHFFRARNI